MVTYKEDSEASSASGSELEQGGEPEYFIKKVLDHREDKYGNREYFVSWKGYDETDNSWQLEADMPTNKSLVNAYWKAKGGDPSAKNGKKRVLSTTYASVDSLARAEKKPTDLDGVDATVLARIRKALKLADHEGTGEAEARAAMRLAHKMMQSLNINQADVMASEDVEKKMKRAGMSTVAINWRNPAVKKTSPVVANWLCSLAWAMLAFFDVKWYSTKAERRKVLVFSFYGIAENSVAAAMAFEMCANLILTWCEEKKGKDFQANAANSYMDGIANGLCSMAEAANKAEEAAAAAEEKRKRDEQIAEEEAARRKQLERLNGPSHLVEEIPEDTPAQPAPLPDPVENSRPRSTSAEEDDEVLGTTFHDPSDDSDTGEADFHDDEETIMDLDAEIEKADTKVKEEKRSPSPPVNGSRNHSSSPEDKVKAEEEEKDVKVEVTTDEVKKEEEEQPETIWSSSAQLVLFRQNAKYIAEEFEKKKKLKIRHSTKTYKRKYDRSAYRMGETDAKQIDVKRARIEA